MIGKLLCFLFGHKTPEARIEHRPRLGDKRQAKSYWVDGYVYYCPRCGKKMSGWRTLRRWGTAKNWWY